MIIVDLVNEFCSTVHLVKGLDVIEHAERKMTNKFSKLPECHQIFLVPTHYIKKQIIAQVYLVSDKVLRQNQTGHIFHLHLI